MGNVNALARLNLKGGMVAPSSQSGPPPMSAFNEIVSYGNRLWIGGGVAPKPAPIAIGPAPLSYTHVQALSASAWTINHAFGLPGTPSVMVWDAAGNIVTPISLTVVSASQIIVGFGISVTGHAVVSMPNAMAADSVKIGGVALSESGGQLLVGGTAISLQNHSHSYASLTGKPTTIAGFGITDALSISNLDAHVAAADPHPQYMRSLSFKTTANSTSSSTTLNNAAAAAIALAANTVYRITLYVRFSSAATGTGIRLGLTCPTGSVISASVSIPVRSDSTSGSLQGTIVVSGDSVQGTGVELSNTAYIAVIQGVVSVGATAGNLQLQYATEVSGSAVTVLPHSVGFADIV